MTDDRTEYWGSIGSAWSRRRPQRLWRAHSDAANRALLARWLPGGTRRVLKTDAFDEAFGEGLMGFIEGRSPETWMIDISAVILHEGRRTHPRSNAVAADVRSLPFPAESFGAVVSTSTLDHFADPADIEVALAEIHRVLDPGGCLIVTLDNPENPAVGLRNRLPWGWLHRIGLVPYYVGETLGRRGLVELLERVGFAVTDVDAVQHVPRAPTVLAAGLIARSRWGWAERAFLRAIARTEAARRWRSRFRTGYFVAVRGIRR